MAEEIKIIDETKNDKKPNEVVDVIKKDSEKAIQNYHNNGVGIIADRFKKGDIDANKAGKEIVDIGLTAKATQDTEENKKFLKEATEIKQEELKSHARENLARQEADRIAAQQKKAEAFYISFRPILEFDLDHLLVKKSNRVKYTRQYDAEKGKMIKVPVNEAEMPEEPIETKPKHTYEERSYGIPLMVMMLIVLTIPYFIATICLAVFNMINYLFVAISRFSKPAFIICTGVAGITLVGIFIYVVLLCIQAAFNVQIIPDNVAEVVQTATQITEVVE